MYAFYAAIGWLIFTIFMLVLVRQRLRVLQELQLTPLEQLLPAPRLSVIIPARNEQDNIERCLLGLVQQTYPTDALEIIVVDDRSSDDTAMIVQKLSTDHPQIQLIEAGPLPEGWQGKSHACWRGKQNANGVWLCFMDADVAAEPDLLNSAVAYANAHRHDLLTLFPFQEMLGFWERLLMPLAFLSLLFLMDPKRINDPGSKDAMAMGHFILVGRGAYEATGGHQTIRSEFLDDVALARIVKGKGFRLHLGSGGELVRTRMYSDLRGLWRGLTRGATEVAGGIPMTTFSVFSSLLIGWMPILLPIWALRSSVALSGEGLVWPTFGFTFLGIALWLAAHVISWRHHRIPLGYIFLLPLSYTALAVVSLESLWRFLTKRRSWKGRFY
jgi:chlorobactene glucosyltransferase